MDWILLVAYILGALGVFTTIALGIYVPKMLLSLYRGKNPEVRILKIVSMLHSLIILVLGWMLSIGYYSETSIPRMLLGLVGTVSVAIIVGLLYFKYWEWHFKKVINAFKGQRID